MKAELRKRETTGMQLEGEEESKKERKWKREERDTRMIEVEESKEGDRIKE